jgi:ABC-type antimicrobial peptide transport system permease subunit
MHISPKEHINYIFVKVRLDDHQQVMKVLEAEWAKHTDNAAFNASVLDENLQAWYEEETILTTIFGIASAIAIFLSCLGLFAISLLVIELRTKEIGIRKVMGASVSAIVRMVFIHFFKLIMISLLIALPLGWYAMHSWIENYAYRIQINPLTLFAIGLLVTVVALATVSYHSIKAAILNPVKSLRTE